MASTLSHIVYRAGGGGCTVVVWNAALSGIKGQLEQKVDIRGGLFAYEISMMVEGLDV